MERHPEDQTFDWGFLCGNLSMLGLWTVIMLIVAGFGGCDHEKSLPAYIQCHSLCNGQVASIRVLDGDELNLCDCKP